jgi:hypothetical protein
VCGDESIKMFGIFEVNRGIDFTFWEGSYIKKIWGAIFTSYTFRSTVEFSSLAEYHVVCSELSADT